MAPNPFAPVAYAMQESVVNTIMNKGSDLGGSGFAGGGFSGDDGGGGGGKHHHKGKGNGGGDGINRDVIFGNAATGAGNGKQSFMTAVLAKSSGQHRMGVVVTLAFGIVAALIVIYTIIHDAYRVRPGEVYSRAQKQSSIFKALHPAEVFPFILAVTILIQAFVFIGEQSTGFENFSGGGFQVTSQVIWTVFFLVFLVVVAFSLETAFRGLQKKRFQPRGRLTTPLCLGGVLLATLGLFLYAHFKMPILDIGPLSLSWWTSNWPMVGIVLVGLIAMLHIVAGTIIIVQLLGSVDIQMEERIAASRVVYTMAIDLITITLIVPFWVQLLMDKKSIPLEASFVSDIGITLTGLLFAALHLISRANAERMAIRPKNLPTSGDKRIRLFGSSDLNGRNISAPVLEPKLSVRQRGEMPERPAPPQAGAPPPRPPRPEMQIPNEPPPEYPDLMNLPPVAPRDFITPVEQERPLPPQPAAALPEKLPIHFEVHPGTPVEEGYVGGPSAPAAAHERQPTQGSITSTYSRSSAFRPEPLFATRAHNSRMDSTFTSAEIEIGLRLSNALGDVQGSLEDANMDKSLPTTPRTPEGPKIPQEATVPSPAGPPAPVGIGALGMGPKAGLKMPLPPRQPVRTSPLATTVIKASTPTPTEKQNPFSPPGSRKGSKNTLSPPTARGLPSSPSPRARDEMITSAEPQAAFQSPTDVKSPAAFQSPIATRSPAFAQSPATVQSSAIETSPTSVESSAAAQYLAAAHPQGGVSSPAAFSQRSPTEWPQWPAGNEVDVRTPVERHWPTGYDSYIRTPVEHHWPSGDEVDVTTPVERRWA